MKVRLKLKPGQRGTKHLLQKHGDRLVCVRYRYDEKTKKRYTTVELIVDEVPWQPPLINPDAVIRIKIDFDEKELRNKIKNAGGRWSNSTKTWKMQYKTACTFGLKSRIIDEENKEEKNLSI